MSMYDLGLAQAKYKNDIGSSIFSSAVSSQRFQFNLKQIVSSIFKDAGRGIILRQGDVQSKIDLDANSMYANRILCSLVHDKLDLQFFVRCQRPLVTSF